MKKLIHISLVVLLSMLFTTKLVAQGPGSLFVDAGPDVSIDCSSGGCTDLTATFLETFETISENYTVTSIPYNPPFAFNGLANSVNTNIDDAWSDVGTLPFDFCYFLNVETEFQVGSNGVIRLDVDPGDTGPGSNDWSFTDDIPNNVDPALAEANIFTPGHDIDPSVNNVNEIGWEVLGTFPNRVLVVAYFEVPMFSSSCNNLLATHMAVFYEFSNVIEIYIQDKPVCPSWNSGNATLGIQNHAGTIAFVPPGRNTSDSPWTTNDEAWSFSPDGVPTYVFEWLDDLGNVIGTTPIINVCPTSSPQTYTARVTYTNCNGDVVVLTDDVIVTSSAPFTVDLGPDIVTCSSNDVILDASADAPPAATYQWFLNAVAIPGAINPTYTVVAPNSGTYSVEVVDPVDPTCIVSDSIEVTFLSQPVIANPPIDLFQCDDGSNTGVFDLTVNTLIILGGQDPLIYEVKYYETFIDSQNDTNEILTPAAYPIIGTSQTIYVRIHDIASGTCFELTDFLIEFLPAAAGPMTDFEICDADSNGFVSLDLITLKNPEALGAQDPLQFTVTYHTSQVDADADINPYPNPYVAAAPSETIFVRVENNNNPSCYATDSFVVNIFIAPIANPPTPYVICDDLPNDGFAEFDLTTKDLEITGGNPDAVVSYHTTLFNAQNNQFPLASPYTNTNAGFQTIWARVEHINSPDCFNIVELDLQVDDSPSLTDPITDYVLCDNDGDGVEIFDLRSKDIEILNVLVNVTLTYYETQADAIADTNPIINDTAYANLTDPQVIWVRGENIVNCVTVSSFLLVLDEAPVFVLPTPFEQCDDEIADGFTEFDLNMKNAEISGGDIALSISYYGSQADAESAINPLPIPYTNVVNPETVWVRIEHNITGCYATTPMELIVLEAPAIFPPDPLIYCDDDNDGFGEFILSDADDQVTGGNPGGNLVVTYHLTLVDAQNGDLPILDVPYLNVVPFLQTVYVRVYDQATGCYNITTLDLLVVDSPAIADPSPLVLCDDDGDGIEIFDLTIAEPEILNGLDPLDYTITYYEDPGLTIAIGNPTTYPNITNPQTIYVVVEDNNTGCQSFTTLLLEVYLPPVLVAPTALELCDVNNPGDEMEAFDLESKTDEITGGNPSIVITYHETQGDADAGTNALLSPYVNQVPQPQTIFVRAEDVNTGCIVSDQVTLDLVVNPLPSPVIPTPLEVCDDDNDGFAEFDLASKDLEIIGGEPGVAVSYHETLIDAINGDFALVSPYTNIQTPTQVVYVRAEYPPILGGTGCFRIVELLLVVLPTPEVPLDLEPLVLCDDDGDGIGVFDLTERAPDIYGSQDPADYTLTYYNTFLDADAGTNAIGTPEMYTNTTNPETIYVRLENNVTFCYSLGEFELQVSLGPVVTQPTPYTLCDDLGEFNDGFTEFDLTTKNDEITGGDPNLDVLYYETQADADNNENAIDPDTAYINIINPQTIYIRVTDGNTECYDTTINLTLRVEPNPVPMEPDDLVLCDDNDPGDGIEIFDLTQVEPQVIGTADWDVTYHETYQDAFDNTNAIVTPDAYANTTNPQTIYIRVTNNNTPEGCFEIVTLELIVDPLPDDTAPVEDYIICEMDSDGVAIFDLTTKIAEILNGQDPGIFEVSFYETDVDAVAGMNAIVNPFDYQSDGSASPPGQVIYVGILNTQTGCYIGGVQNFHLLVLEGAQATEPSLPYAICDNLGPNDGIGEFDFILFDSNINGIDIRAEILNGQDPAIYDLTIHETLENAHDNISPLPDLYVNIINPQVVYVRVTNMDTDCYAVTELILKVEELPIVELEDRYRLCLDANGNPLPNEEGELSPPLIDTGLNAGIYSFVWELDGVVITGEIFPFITATQEGDYTVTVTEILTGCTTTASTTVWVSSPPLTYSAEVVSGPFGLDEVIHTDPDGNTETYIDTHVIHVEADGLGEYEFQLDDGPFQTSDIFVGVLPGVHIITIKDVNGCGSVTIELVVIDYPKYVTPNHDGYHDTWNIIGMGSEDPSAKIYIFDRFGKLLKQLSPMGEGWDGTYNGNPMPSSDYWFRVEYTTDNETPKLFKGHFTLKR